MRFRFHLTYTRSDAVESHVLFILGTFAVFSFSCDCSRLSRPLTSAKWTSEFVIVKVLDDGTVELMSRVSHEKVFFLVDSFANSHLRFVTLRRRSLSVIRTIKLIQFNLVSDPLRSTLHHVSQVYNNHMKVELNRLISFCLPSRSCLSLSLCCRIRV